MSRKPENVPVNLACGCFPFVASVALWCLIIASLCGCSSPTAPTDEPFMAEFRAYANKYAECLGLGEVRVRFDTDSGERPHCGAMPGSDLIICKGPVPFENPAGVAAHEVCHLSGLGDEFEAELCAFEVRRDCP